MVAKYKIANSLIERSKFNPVTIPLRVGSALGDRFPWKSGNTWTSLVNRAGKAKFFSFAKISTLSFKIS